MSHLTLIKTIDLIRLFGVKNYRDTAESRHKLVMSLFPQGLGTEPRSHNNILFRFEKDSLGSRCLIRSQIPVANLNSVKSIEEQNITLKTGDYIHFRSVMNPVKRVRNKERFLQDEAEQEDWFINKFSPAMSNIEIIEIKNETVKRSLKSKDFVKLSQFDGIAQVEDAKQLQEFLSTGIGRGKSYGAGLLTVKRMA